MEAINYLQVIPQTPEEKYRMYMKCKKSELARMLLARDMLEPEKYGLKKPYEKNPFDPPYEITCKAPEVVSTTEIEGMGYKYSRTEYSDGSSMSSYSTDTNLK